MERLGEKSRPRRGADQRERRQVDLHRARHRAFADHHVEAEIFHGGVQDLLDGRIEAMDLVHEEDVLGLEIRQDSGQVAGPGDHRPGGQAQAGAHLARHDVGQRRLAQARRARQQDVIERLAAPSGRGQEHGKVVADLVLADVLAEGLRPQLRLDGGIFLERRPGEQSMVFGHRGKSIVDLRRRLFPVHARSTRRSAVILSAAKQPATDPTTEGKPPAVGNAVRRTALTQTLSSRQRRATHGVHPRRLRGSRVPAASRRRVSQDAGWDEDSPVSLRSVSFRKSPKSFGAPARAVASTARSASAFR